MRSIATNARLPTLRQYARTYAERRRKHATNAALMQATQEAARAEATRRSFLSGLNHELRTPLNHIIGFAELLKQADDFVLTEDKRIEYLDLILDAANTLVDQINATLVSSGYGELSPAADPRAKTVVPVLRRLLQEHAQTLFVGKVDIADHLPASALAERDLYRSLQLVFAVLSDERADRQTIGVSVKAHDDGGPVVLIALSVLSGRGKPNTERLRAAQAELIRIGGRLEWSRDERTGYTLVVTLPGEERKQAA